MAMASSWRSTAERCVRPSNDTVVSRWTPRVARSFMSLRRPPTPPRQPGRARLRGFSQALVIS
jgi:hypothetical protein